MFRHKLQSLSMKFVCATFMVILLASVASAVNEVEVLKAQNEYLFSAVSRLEQKISELEAKGCSCKSPVRRQFEGPVTFSYKLAPKVTNVHRDQAILFTSKITDMGGGYDNTTGVYIAPQAGLYMFTCSLLADYDTASNPMLHASIIVDGERVANVFAYSESGIHRDQGANTVFVSLNKGSRVWVKAIDSAQVSVGGDHYSTFSGYLLWPF